MSKEFDKPGQATIETVQNTVNHVLDQDKAAIAGAKQNLVHSLSKHARTEMILAADITHKRAQYKLDDDAKMIEQPNVAEMAKAAGLKHEIPKDKQWTKSEQQFFAELKSKYSISGSAISPLEQQALNALSKELDKPGQVTLEAAYKTIDQLADGDRSKVNQARKDRDEKNEIFNNTSRSLNPFNTDRKDAQDASFKAILKVQTELSKFEANFNELEIPNIHRIAHKSGIKNEHGR